MEAFNGKLIIIAAPSGAGKTTIVRHLIRTFPQLAFSVSVTSRAPRDHEIPGKDYYFVSPEAFRSLVDQNAFLEWEEVYENQFYGTLRSEVERLWKEGKHVLFDIDVKGAQSLKKVYGAQALAIFVKPPSMQTLKERLMMRQTETPESLFRRLSKFGEEMAFENQFDRVLVNDVLERALQEAEHIVGAFIQS